ncbi:MAG: hypothetical protein II557_00745, partial [Clostridia bacterium]|nr:hypothetical protein [Clostridia bacterium]
MICSRPDSDKNGLSQIGQKFSPAFSKMASEDAQHPECRGQRPDPHSAECETPKTSREFLFLVLFLLDKGEKER